MFARLFLFSALASIAAAPAATNAAETTVTISQGVDPITMDPLKVTVTPTDNALLQMFDTLLRHDASGQLRPLLARSYKRIAPTIWNSNCARTSRFGTATRSRVRT